MAEYTMSLYEAIWEVPVTVAVILLPIAQERHGQDVKGPSYTQDASINARNRARTFLHENFTIIDDPSLPWQLG